MTHIFKTDKNPKKPGKKGQTPPAAEGLWKGAKPSAADIVEIMNRGDVSAASALKETLKDDSNEFDVRALSATVLGVLGDVSAAPLLMEALHDPYKEVRHSAFHALEKIGKSPLPQLLQDLRHGDKDAQEKAAVMLTMIGKPAVDGLREATKDENRDVRELAVRVLGDIGVEAAVPEIMERLWDEDMGVRFRAADAMDKIGGAALSLLLDRVVGEEVAERRKAERKAVQESSDKYRRMSEQEMVDMARGPSKQKDSDK